MFALPHEAVCPFCGRVFEVVAVFDDAAYDDEDAMNLDWEIECPCGATKYGGPSECEEE